MRRRDALKTIGALVGAAGAARLLPGCDPAAPGEATAASGLTLHPPTMERLSSDAGWGSTWTHIVPGRWSSTTSFTGLLFYNQSAGIAELYNTDGAGHRIGPPLQRYTNWRHSWSHVVPGYYSGSGVNAAYSGVLLYDPIAGYVAIYSTDGHGNLSVSPIAEIASTRGTWTHIVPGFFTRSRCTSVLLYSRTEGIAEIWSIDDTTGALSKAASYSGWRTSWTHIVGAELALNDPNEPPPSYSDLLFYEGSSGHAEVYKCSDGLLVLAQAYDGLPTGITTIVPGNFGGGSGVSDLLLHGGAGRPAGHLSFRRLPGLDSFSELDIADSGIRATSGVLIGGNFWGDPEDHWFFDGPIQPSASLDEAQRLADVRSFRLGAGGFTDLFTYDKAAGVGEGFLHEPPGSMADEREPIWGYARATTSRGNLGMVSTGSVLPGQAIDFHVSSQVGPCTIKIYSLAGAFMANVSATAFSTPPQQIPRFAYRDGAQWPVVASFPIPAGWPSGIYVGRVEAVAAGHAPMDLPFVVRSPSPGAHKLLVVVQDATYEAYNVWGGRSLYGASFHDRDSMFTAPEAADGLQPYAFKVSFNRPFRDMFGGVDKWAQQEKAFAIWLSRQPFGVDYCTARDLDLGDMALDPASGYRLMVFPGHHEYWSKNMRLQVKSFTDRGGNLAFFAGNVCWWQVRFDHVTDQVICYKRGAFDPFLDGANADQTTVHWVEAPVNWPSSGKASNDPSSSLTGVNWSGAVTDPANNVDDRFGFEVELPRLDHWVFQDALDLMGPSLPFRFGLTGDANFTVAASELDAIDDRSPASFVVLAKAFRPNRQQSCDRGLNAPGDEPCLVATMGVFQPNPSSTVFTSACINWTLGLSQTGAGWNAVDQITLNVLRTLGCLG
jgi:hypothetical protein